MQRMSTLSIRIKKLGHFSGFSSHVCIRLVASWKNSIGDFLAFCTDVRVDIYIYIEIIRQRWSEKPRAWFSHVWSEKISCHFEWIHTHFKIGQICHFFNLMVHACTHTSPPSLPPSYFTSIYGHKVSYVRFYMTPKFFYIYNNIPTHYSSWCRILWNMSFRVTFF